MEKENLLEVLNMNFEVFAKGVVSLNEITKGKNLSLTKAEALKLNEERKDILSHLGRIEFKDGILKKIILNFYTSPFISSSNYYEVISSLQEAFYYIKDEMKAYMSDDEIIEKMRLFFDSYARGDVDFLLSDFFVFSERERNKENEDE